MPKYNKPDTPAPHNWRNEGPRSDLARYAFGWSDKKPDATFWIIIALMMAFIAYKFAMLT